MEDIKKIEFLDAYFSLYDFLEDNMRLEFWEKLDEDDICFLKHCDDFESYTYVLINYDFVLVSISGSVVSAQTIEKFMEETQRMLEEDREERTEE